MALKLGYPDRIVEVDDGVVYLFKGRLYRAPLSEVLNYYLRGEAVLPAPIKEVAADIARALLGAGEVRETSHFQSLANHGVKA
jgi:hypothetical protein